MADELSADLELDIRDALNAVDDLRDELEDTIRRTSDEFSDSFASAVSGVPDVDITANVDDVAPAIEGAISGVEADVPVTAETAEAEAALSGLGEGIEATVAVTADTSAALDAIEELAKEVEAQQAEFTITGDTTDAVSSVEDLAAASADAEEPLDAAAGATTAFGAAGGLATGSIDALSNTAGGLAANMGPIGGIIAGGVVSLGAFTTQAVNSLGSLERMDTAFGNLSKSVQQINVGTLNADLGDLAIKTGSSGSAMRNAATDAFQLLTSYGKTREESARFSEQLLAISARAVALNPNLGETGDVATRMFRAFQSGNDRALKPYALGITAAEISTRALAIAQEDGRAAVNAADKAMASAQLTVEKFGKSMKRDIEEGTKNPILQMRAIGKEFTKATTEIGKPLVAPVFKLLRESLPSVKAVAEAIAALAEGALPVLTSALDALAPILRIFVNVLEAIPGPLLVAGAAIIGFSGALKKTGEEGEVAKRHFDILGGESLSLGDKIGRTAAGAALAVAGFQSMEKASGFTTEGLLSFVGAGAAIGSIFPGWGTAIGAGAGAVIGLGVALAQGGETMEEYRKRFAGLGKTLEDQTATQALKTFVKALGETDRAAAGIGVTSAEITKNWRMMGTHVGQTAGEIKGDAKAVKDEFEALATSAPKQAQKVLEGFRTMRSETGKPLFTGKEFDILEGAVNKGIKAHQGLQQESRLTAIANQQAVLSVNSVETELVGYTAAVIFGGNATERWANMSDQARGALDLLQGALFGATGAQLSYEQAVAAVEQANVELYAVLSDPNSTVAEREAAMLRVREADLAVVQSAAALEQAEAELLTSVGSTSVGLDGEIARLQQLQRDNPATAASYNEPIYKLIELKAKIDAMPPEKRTKLGLDGWNESVAALDDINNKLNLFGKERRVRLHVEGYGLYSEGGFVEGTGHRDTVPALLTPGEYVMTREQVAAARKGRAFTGTDGGGGGGATIGSMLTIENVTVTGNLDERRARKIGEALGQGAVDAMTRRNVITQARLG